MVQHSPDGLHWTEDPGPFSHERGDENLGVMYDPVSKKYVGICRNVYPGPMLVHRTERSIFRMQSNDLIHWSTPLPIIDRDELDPLDIDFEGMWGMYYEGMYLGFLRVSHTAPSSMERGFIFAPRTASSSISSKLTSYRLRAFSVSRGSVV